MPDYQSNSYWQPNWMGGGGQQTMPMNYNPMPQGGGGGGWLAGLGNTLMGPAGLPIMMGMNLLTGILGGIFQGGQKKKIKNAFQGQQKQYQGKAAELFPELNQQSFQYQNPMNEQIMAALNSRMGNFGNWGWMPQNPPQQR